MKSGSPDFGYIWYQLLKYTECLTCFLKKKDDFHWKKKTKRETDFLSSLQQQQKKPMEGIDCFRHHATQLSEKALSYNQVLIGLVSNEKIF